MTKSCLEKQELKYAVNCNLWAMIPLFSHAMSLVDSEWSPGRDQQGGLSWVFELLLAAAGTGAGFPTLAMPLLLHDFEVELALLNASSLMCFVVKRR